MKKFITSMVFVFAMLVGVVGFVGCGGDEFSGAEVVDANTVTEYVETVDASLSGGYSVSMSFEGQNVLAMEVVVVNAGTDDASLQMKAVVDFPATPVSVALKASMYVKDNMVYISQGGKNFKMDTEAAGGSVADSVLTMGEQYSQLLEGFLAELTDEDTVIKRIVDEGKDQVKFQISQTTTRTDGENAVTLEATMKIVFEQGKLSMFEATANEAGAVRVVTVKTIQSIDFAGVDFENGFNDPIPEAV